MYQTLLQQMPIFHSIRKEITMWKKIKRNWKNILLCILSAHFILDVIVYGLAGVGVYTLFT